MTRPEPCIYSRFALIVIFEAGYRDTHERKCSLFVQLHVSCGAKGSISDRNDSEHITFQAEATKLLPWVSESLDIITDPPFTVLLRTMCVCFVKALLYGSFLCKSFWTDPGIAAVCRGDFAGMLWLRNLGPWSARPCFKAVICAWHFADCWG